MRRRSLALTFFVFAIGVGGSTFISSSVVHAGTQTSNLSVTTSVSGNCSIATSAVSFGSYEPVTTNVSSALNGTGSVTVTCTSGASTSVTLGQGANSGTGSSDAAPVRRMTDGGGHYISYTLYSDSSRTTVWGNTSGTGVSHTGTGSSTALTVYGQVAAGQNVPSGNYSDTVVATITF